MKCQQKLFACGKLIQWFAVVVHDNASVDAV